jgi:hypothetical protein
MARNGANESIVWEKTGVRVGRHCACALLTGAYRMSQKIAADKSASVTNCWSRGRGLKTNFVVDRISEPLLASEVAFRCLNADVAEQELNLFKFPACLVT